jgi:hypothetical protein
MGELNKKQMYWKAFYLSLLINRLANYVIVFEFLYAKFVLLKKSFLNMEDKSSLISRLFLSTVMIWLRGKLTDLNYLKEVACVIPGTFVKANVERYLPNIIRSLSLR